MKRDISELIEYEHFFKQALFDSTEFNLEVTNSYIHESER